MTYTFFNFFKMYPFLPNVLDCYINKKKIKIFFNPQFLLTTIV